MSYQLPQPGQQPSNPEIDGLRANVRSMEQAIYAMAAGQREVSVRFSDGSAVTYENVQMPALEKGLLYARNALRAAEDRLNPCQRSRRIRSVRMFPQSGYR